MHDGYLCEVCDTMLLSSQLLRMFSVQTPSVTVFSVVCHSCGIVRRRGDSGMQQGFCGAVESVEREGTALCSGP